MCNGTDDDCDGLTDEDATFATWYADADGDSYGNPFVSQSTCNGVPTGYVADGHDCNDANANVNPGMTEICANGIDDNCDGQVDENCTVYTYYADADGDTYGNPASSITSNSSTPPAGYVVDNTDCNDNNAAIHPGATEQCNGIDDNCDGLVDNGITYTTYYPDADGDGYGSSLSSGTSMCSNPGAGYSTNNTDCNDANAAVNPGAYDVCNGIDDNCNGTIDENPLVATISPSGTVTACRLAPVTLTANTGSGILYQWYKGNALQPGATNSTYTTTKRGTFHVVETTGFCTSTSANTTVARLATSQAAIIVFGNTDICSTGSVVLRANQAPNNVHTYQWSKGGIPIFGATDRNYTATATGSYTVTVQNNNGCSTTSAPVNVTSSCK